MTKKQIIRDLKGERKNLIASIANETGTDQWSAAARREMQARVEVIDRELRTLLL